MNSLKKFHIQWAWLVTKDGTGTGLFIAASFLVFAFVGVVVFMLGFLHNQEGERIISNNLTQIIGGISALVFFYLYFIGAGYAGYSNSSKNFKIAIDKAEKFVAENPENIQAIEIPLSKPGKWNSGALEELRNKLRKNDFSEKDLQKGHELVYKKPLADIISMIKHASDFQLPILTAQERVEKAISSIMGTKQFTDEQQTWLAYIKEHLIKNLAIAIEDFEIMPVFERHGGLSVAKKVFGDDINLLINKINETLAA